MAILYIKIRPLPCSQPRLYTRTWDKLSGCDHCKLIIYQFNCHTMTSSNAQAPGTFLYSIDSQLLQTIQPVKTQYLTKEIAEHRSQRYFIYRWIKYWRATYAHIQISVRIGFRKGLVTKNDENSAKGLPPGRQGHVGRWHEYHGIDLGLRKGDQSSKVQVGTHPVHHSRGKHNLV